MEFPVGMHCSWTLKTILKSKDKITEVNWADLLEMEKFPTGEVYRKLRGIKEDVPWKKLFFGNRARPRALFIAWMVCHGRINTKDRLQRFGNYPVECCFCGEDESIKHLLFDCKFGGGTWKKVLEWIKV